MIYQKKIVLSISMATLLTACGAGSSSSSDSGQDAGGLPSSGNIGDGPAAPAPAASIPDQPSGDNGALVLSGGLHSIFSSAVQPILNFDLENNKILVALSGPNALKIIDISSPVTPVTISDEQFATSITPATPGGYEEEEGDEEEYESDFVAFSDDDDDDDDDYGSGASIIYSNSLAGAALDVTNNEKVWAVVPYRTATALETSFGIAYSTQYGVYTGDLSLLTAAGENSDSFLRSMAAASDGTLQAQTGYIQKMIQAANGRTLGLQVHLESGVRIVELDSKAVVIGQSPALALGSSDELLHWTVGKDGKKLALVTMDSAGQHNLHLIDVSALDSATMSNSSVLPINAMASSAEKVTDIAFFNSSNSIAVSIGNRVALVDVNQGNLVARSELSFSDAVMGIESDVRRGFLAVLQGKNIELRAIENPSQIVSSLQLNEEFTSLDMEENNLVVSNTTEYQMITF